VRQGGGAGAGDGPLSPPAVRAQLYSQDSNMCKYLRLQIELFSALTVFLFYQEMTNYV
jgi:hypothetical protein